MEAGVQYDTGLLADHYHSFGVPGFFEQTTIRLGYDLARIELNGWIPLRGRTTARGAAGTVEAFERLPNFQLIGRTALKELSDESRPEGWGLSTELPGEGQRVLCGGEEYFVDLMIEGRFRAEGDKQAVYMGCLQAVQTDFMAAIRDPGHQVSCSLEDGLRSLRTALTATAQALKESPSVN